MLVNQPRALSVIMIIYHSPGDCPLCNAINATSINEPYALPYLSAIHFSSNRLSQTPKSIPSPDHLHQFLSSLFCPPRLILRITRTIRAILGGRGKRLSLNIPPLRIQFTRHPSIVIYQMIQKPCMLCARDPLLSLLSKRHEATGMCIISHVTDGLSQQWCPLRSLNQALAFLLLVRPMRASKVVILSGRRLGGRGGHEISHANGTQVVDRVCTCTHFGQGLHDRAVTWWWPSPVHHCLIVVAAGWGVGGGRHHGGRRCSRTSRHLNATPYKQ